MKAVLIVVAALGLTGCGSAEYAYDYDAYGGPRGHYAHDFLHPQQVTVACARTVYLGPYDGGMRGPYYAGPYCLGPDGRAVSPVDRRR